MVFIYQDYSFTDFSAHIGRSYATMKSLHHEDE